MLLLALLLPLLAGCQGRGAEAEGTGDTRIRMTVSPAPPSVGPAKILVQLSGPDGTPIEGASVQVRGDMTHAGMQPVIAEARATGDGRYETEGFAFDMGGDWVLTVRAEIPGGQRVERAFAVDGVAGKRPSDGGHEHHGTP